MDELKNILEALIFISVEPLTLEKIKEVLNDVPEEEILQALLNLGTEMESAPRAIRLVQTGGGWVFMTKPAFDPPVRKLLQIERRKKLSPAALEGLERGRAALPPEVRARTSVLAGEAGAHAGAIDAAEVVIADPPRKGLEPQLLDALCARPPARVALVSCNLTAGLREVRRLREAGLTLSALTPYALFPHTDHVETVALFERSTPP